MSTLNLENIKHPDSASNNISVDSSGNVGIGTGSPAYDLDVSGNTAATRFWVDAGGNAIDPMIRVKTDTNTGLFFPADDTIGFSTGGTERMRIDSAGRVTLPDQPFFHVTISGNPTSVTNADVPFDKVVQNTGGYFNTSTYRFTVPISGMYQFNANLRVDSASASAGRYHHYRVHVNGLTGAVNSEKADFIDIPNDGQYMGANFSFALYLNANDYVTIRNDNHSSLGGNYLGYQNTFSGYLIG